MADGPRFVHLDDVKWQEVRRQRHRDHDASVREKWLDFSPEFLSLYAKWDPGMIVQPHGHNSNHVVYVLEGEMTCGDVHCVKGTHVDLRPQQVTTGSAETAAVPIWRSGAIARKNTWRSVVWGRPSCK